MHSFLKLLCFSLFVFALGCVEDWQSNEGDTSESDQGDTQNVVRGEGSVQLKAITYMGRSPFGEVCDLSISMVEVEDNGSKEIEIFVKYYQMIHGRLLRDLEHQVLRYRLSENRFFEADSTATDTQPALLSVLLSDETFEVDFNKLASYEAEGLLLQSARVDFSMDNFEEYLEVMREVTLLGEPLDDQKKAIIDRAERFVFKIKHQGHYDALVCSQLALLGMEDVNYDIEIEQNHSRGSSNKNHQKGNSTTHGHDHKHDDENSTKSKDLEMEHQDDHSGHDDHEGHDHHNHGSHDDYHEHDHHGHNH